MAAAAATATATMAEVIVAIVAPKQAGS